jgi:PAS domain S-box-containing protein
MTTIKSLATHQQEALLASVMRTTDVMLVYLDLNFNFVWVNQAYANTCKMAPVDMIGKNHFALYPNTENESIFIQVRNSGQSVFYKDKPFEFPDQPERGITYWDWSLVADKDQNAGVVGLVFSLRETTCFVQAQLTARKNEEYLSTIFNHIHDIVFVINVEPGEKFRFISVNNRFEAVTGLPKELIIGKLIEHVIPESSLPLVLRKYKDAINEKKVVYWEETSTYPSGEKIAEASVSPVFDQNGNCTQLVGIVHDITERKRDEAAAKAKNEEIRHTLNLLQAITNGSKEAIFAKDLNGRYLIFNQEALRESGKTLDAVIGKGDEDVYSPQAAEAIKTYDRQVISSAQTITFEEKINTVDGERFFLTTKGPIRDDAGNVFGVFGISHDITERKQSENALTESLRLVKEKERAKSRFLASASHDLRQPLSAANLFIDALKSTKPTFCQIQIINKLDQAMSNFNGLLDALLNVSKLDAGMIKPDLIAINLIDLFNWLEQSTSPMVNEKALALKFHLSPKKKLIIRADIDLIKSVLINLVTNAIKFTSKGRILVSARQRGNAVLIQIWDTGAGIPNEHIEHIFDEFYQVDNPQRDRTSGLGLGLSIAKRALALLDGEITCRSNVGHGSVFEFQLPLDASSSEPEHQESTSLPCIDAKIFVQDKRFVIIDDDPLVADALSSALIGMNGRVKLFHSAEKALRHPNIRDTDYFIVDYMLGGKFNGIQFLEQLSDKFNTPIKAVLMTGDTSTQLIRTAEIHDWRIVYKPANLSKIIPALAE